MDKKYFLKPSSFGEEGENTIFDFRFFPVKTYHVEYVFLVYPDDIFCAGRDLYVAAKLYDAIIDAGYTGLDNARLITYRLDPQYYNSEIPTQNYYFVDVIGTPNDDIYFELDPTFSFIVSERMKALMKQFRIKYTVFEEYNQ